MVKMTELPFFFNGTSTNGATYPHVPKAHTKTTCVVYNVVLLCAGLFLNVSPTSLFFIKPHLRSPSNLLLASLTSSNCILFFIIIPVILYNNYHPNKPYEGRVCDLFGFWLQLWWSSNMLTLMFISYERNIFISQAMFYKQQMTLSKIYICIVVIWLASFIISLLPVFGFSKYVFHKNEHICNVEWRKSYFFDWMSRSFTFIIPIFVTVFCYSRIVYHASKNANSLLKMTNTSSQHRNFKKRGSSKKAVKTSIAVVVSLLLITTPYVIITQIFFKTSLVIKVTFNMTFLISIVFPYLFIYRNKVLRKELRKLFFRMVHRDVRQIHPSVEIDESDYIENVSRRNSKTESEIFERRRYSADFNRTSIELFRRWSSEIPRRFSLELPRRSSSTFTIGTGRRESGKSTLTTVDI